MLAQICDAAKIKINALPWLKQYMEEGRNKLCYNNVLGVCSHGQHCRFVHAPKTAIRDDFAAELCKVIKPGVEWLVRNGDAAPGPGTERRNVKQCRY